MNDQHHIENAQRAAMPNRINKIPNAPQRASLTKDTTHICDANCRRLTCLLRKARQRALASFAVVAALLSAPAFAAEENSTEKGYFLSLNQKQELITRGEITDSKGNQYAVNFVPGYVEPVADARESLDAAGNKFQEYAEADPYRKISESYADGTEAIETTVKEEWARGIPNAWSDAFEKANTATERQTFGWPLAYPWALVKSTIDTTGRLGWGSAKIGGATLFSYAAAPAYYLVEPAAAGSAQAAIGGALFPAAQIGWNTAVAPPLALLGRKPSPERADGFFVELKSKEAGPEVSSSSDEPVSDETAAGCCSFLSDQIRMQMGLTALEMYQQML